MGEIATDTSKEPTSGETTPRQLSPAAERALAEAAYRRRQASPVAPPKEIAGRPGPEPTRYGDWEAKGIACDF